VHGRTVARPAILTTPEIDADLRGYISESVRNALAEDIGGGDLTAALVPQITAVNATVVTREQAILCGQPWFDEVFAQLSTAVKISWQALEGSLIAPGAPLCRLSGPARPVLTGERTALNFLQTLSATATAARSYADAVQGTQAKVLDTRKTLPGLRRAQKYAVRAGGAWNHRIGLFDAILIKENHIVASGSIAHAVQQARHDSPHVLIQVEVENIDQLREAFAAGADRLLLDNFDQARMREAVALRQRLAPAIGLEASGGITLTNIREVALTGVDFISVGDMTKNLHAVDLSMRFQFAGT
jgi:nicotinate-nucleotide pyrophosphorylase (carboxylating)